METPVEKYIALLGEKDCYGMKEPSFSPKGFIVETEDQAWNLFEIKPNQQGYYVIDLIPYSGKKTVGSKIKKTVTVSYR